MSTFFNFKKIDGCNLSCYYTDACNTDVFTDSHHKLHIKEAFKKYPWEIQVSKSNRDGYQRKLCLKCTSNNLFSL